MNVLPSWIDLKIKYSKAQDKLNACRELEAQSLQATISGEGKKTWRYASLQKYLSPVEGLVWALEAIRFSARSRQTDIVAFLVPMPIPNSNSGAAGAARAE